MIEALLLKAALPLGAICGGLLVAFRAYQTGKEPRPDLTNLRLLTLAVFMISVMSACALGVIIILR